MNELIQEWLPRKLGISYQTGILFCMFSLGIVEDSEQDGSPMAIKKTFPENSLDIVYLGMSFLQKWKLLAKPLEKLKMEALVETVLEKRRNSSP
jgi:hypothetical protein